MIILYTWFSSFKNANLNPWQLIIDFFKQFKLGHEDPVAKITENHKIIYRLIIGCYDW